ncbi:Fur family transcriptional regulator [Lentzea sp. NPDC051213]|uniref:Fur family transcriptional regulator n=1 Tax=Lentzea sp. NPDC051213 TaxID=3364126 RepID=UPI0037931A0A
MANSAEADQDLLRQQLKAWGLRVTAPRLSVLGYVQQHPHATAAEVAEGVRNQLGTVSTQAIYDVLNAWTAADHVRRTEFAGHPARFETRIGDNHHHAVCRKCGRTEDVDCAVNYTPCLTPSHDWGFDLDEAEVIYWGVCPECRKAEQNAPSESA